MKSIYALLLSAVVFCSCSDEEPLHKQQFRFRNTSTSPLSILITGDLTNSNKNDTLIHTILQQGESTEVFTYNNYSFVGIPLDFKYMKLIFTRNKRGYICSDKIEDNLCFTNKKSPISEATSADDFSLENGVYYFDITSEDCQYAQVLP